MPTLEWLVGKTNEHFFLKEFTYSRNQFKSETSELELADSIVWLDEYLLVSQLKERMAATTDEKVESTWFEKKVLGKATKQIRDTLTYLRTWPTIELTSGRGDKLPLRFSAILHLQKVVCFSAGAALPQRLAQKKFHESDTAGVIHIFSKENYQGVVNTLMTVSEVFDYLEFRKKLIERWKTAVDHVPEQALVGQYIGGDLEDRPDVRFLEPLAALQHNVEEWDMSGVIGKFQERRTTGPLGTEYYRVIGEVAKLKRSELKEFKRRFKYGMEKAKAKTFAMPTRMQIPRTDCSFVFVPVEPENFPRRTQGLENFLHGCKYDLKTRKCVAICFWHDSGDWYDILWAFADYAWEFDEEMDLALKKSNPFRPVAPREAPRYDFRP